MPIPGWHNATGQRRKPGDYFVPGILSERHRQEQSLRGRVGLAHAIAWV